MNTPPPLFKQDKPVIPVRGIHLDLKGLPPTFARLMELVRLFEALRLNAIVVEWEDAFPWMCDVRLRSQTAYTPEQIREFAAECASREIEIIPLVQCMGHAENVLSKPGYEALREVSHRTDVFHPLHPDSPALVRRLIHDVLALLPEVRRFHLGGDEAYTLGQHEKSKAFAAKHGMAQLYLQQVEPIIADLEARGIRPLLWHDELVAWAHEDLVRLSSRVDLVVWGYSGSPSDPDTYHYRLPHVEKLASAGYELWAASSYKGADGANANRPNPLARQISTQGWVDLHTSFHWKGMIATGWSRYASGRIQVTPIEAALDTLVLTALFLHDGSLPEAPLSLSEAWLDAYGEGAAFRRCKTAMEHLTRHTDKAWDWIRQLEEQAANLELEPKRAHSGFEETIIDLLEGEFKALQQVALQVEYCLHGRIPEPWAKYYNLSRVRPIEVAIARLKTTLRTTKLPPSPAVNNMPRAVEMQSSKEALLKSYEGIC